MTITVRRATEADINAAASVLANAFHGYPFLLWTVAADRHVERIAGLQRLALERKLRHPRESGDPPCALSISPGMGEQMMRRIASSEPRAQARGHPIVILAKAGIQRVAYRSVQAWARR